MNTDNIPAIDLEEQEEGWSLEPLDYEYALKTKKRYVCSNCWGELHLEFVKNDPQRRYYVVCLRCGIENTNGYVTKVYADRRRQESIIQKPAYCILFFYNLNHFLYCS